MTDFSMARQFARVTGYLTRAMPKTPAQPKSVPSAPDGSNSIASPDAELMYPQLTPAQQQEAIDNLERYLAVVLRIFQSTLADEGASEFSTDA